MDKKSRWKEFYEGIHEKLPEFVLYFILGSFLTFAFNYWETNRANELLIKQSRIETMRGVMSDYCTLVSKRRFGAQEVKWALEECVKNKIKPCESEKYDDAWKYYKEGLFRWNESVKSMCARVSNAFGEE